MTDERATAGVELNEETVADLDEVTDPAGAKGDDGFELPGPHLATVDVGFCPAHSELCATEGGPYYCPGGVQTGGCWLS